MSLNSINNFLTKNAIWFSISIFSLLLLLSPLLFYNGVFYVPIFDNLDSTVVWYKILTESGKIFSENSTIIPNMMHGLPRSSYFGEFNIILWLYYFFSPKTAYIINEILIHLVAFFSMFIFLNKYLVQKKQYYKNIPVYIGALYFALLPYWSGAGLSIAILPLVTYSLLNIKNRISTKWDWILLLVLPLYTSFIFIFMFYIIMGGIYLIWTTLKTRKLNVQFFLALFLMGTVFLLTEYRLLYAMFIESGFISHRTEFNIFYTNNFLDTYRKVQMFFLGGHLSHLSGLQYYILPLIIISMILSLSRRRFNQKESMFIFILILLSFILGIWDVILRQLYTLPILISFTLYLSIFSKKDKLFGRLMLLQLFLAFLGASQHYSGLEKFADTLPIFHELNITRIAFIQPFLWGILFSYSALVIARKVHFSNIFITIFIFIQIFFSYTQSFYQSTPKSEYASFNQYYAPNLFAKLKKKIPEPLDSVRIVSYGLEPSVSLYNGFYTIDGYSVNYPLQYKHKFRNVIATYLDKKENSAARKLYDRWGGTVYILTTTVTLKFYNKNIIVQHPAFDVKGLCDLDTDYLISSHELNITKKPRLTHLDKFEGESNSWDIFLYKISCQYSTTMH